VITAAPGIPNGDAFDIAGKGFGEGNIKLGRSSGVRKDVELWRLRRHAATIQSPGAGPDPALRLPAPAGVGLTMFSGQFKNL
jgi:hypothetical protein